MASTDRSTSSRARRYECKYAIPQGLALAIRDAVAPHVVPDVHAADRPDHTYPISSLYFDTSGLALYQETKEGKDRRFKLRIRAYDDDPDHPVFLEIKRRYGGLVAKSRAAALRRDLAWLTPGDVLSPRGSEVPPAVGGEFLYLVYQLAARPRIVVRYDREAYVGALDDSVRVTFDRRLRHLHTDSIEIPVVSPRFVAARESRVVLELKFNDVCPYWVQMLVRHFGLERRSFSKYGRSIDAASDSLSAAAPGGTAWTP